MEYHIKDKNHLIAQISDSANYQYLRDTWISGRAKWSRPLILKRFTGDSQVDSENDLKINIFLAAVESAVDVDADLDADMVFTDPAQIICKFGHLDVI